MTVDILTREAKGARLTYEEMDDNLLNIKAAIEILQGINFDGEGIASITSDGSSFTITGTAGTVWGPFTLPVGATWLTSSGVPSDTDGRNGDLNFDTSTGDIYTKAGGSWGAPIANIEGPTGPQGITGAQGVTGPQGAQGLTGPQGAVGSQGVTGPQGVQGVTGPIGFTGPDGFTGPQGVQGLTGPQGLDGVTGAGVTGPQGITGEQGPAGPTNIYVDTGAPDNGDGADGDVYIDGANGDLYRKESGVWDLKGNILGPQGAEGDPGAQGATGPQGITGAQGVTGPQGVTGNGYTVRQQSLTPVAGGSLQVNFDDIDLATVVLTDATTTFDFTGGRAHGNKRMLQLIQGTGGNKAVVLPTGPDGVAYGSDIPTLPTLSTAAGKTDYLGFIYNPISSKWEFVSVARGF